MDHRETHSHFYMNVNGCYAYIYYICSYMHSKSRYFTLTEATSSLVRHDFVEYACYSSIAPRIRSLSSSANGKFHGDQSRGAFRAILQELTECLLRWVVDAAAK